MSKLIGMRVQLIERTRNHRPPSGGPTLGEVVHVGEPVFDRIDGVKVPVVVLTDGGTFWASDLEEWAPDPLPATPNVPPPPSPPPQHRTREERMNASSNAGAGKEELGLYKKFICYRADGRDQPGREREEARYFVSDYRYDPHAWLAVCSYMTTCSGGYPKLARDLGADLLDVYPKLVADTRAAAVFRGIMDTLGLPADMPFTDSPMYKLVAKFAAWVPGTTVLGGCDGDQEAGRPAGQRGAHEGHQAEEGQTPHQA